MKKYVVYNIKYDTDGEDIELPTRLEIEIPDDIIEQEDVEQMLSDEISNITGFCHFGFLIENKKDYYRQDNVGKCKYTVNFHNGIDKHKDGSKFYGIKTFKNKPSLFKFIAKLENEGYVMK